MIANASDRGHELFYYTAMQVAFGTGELIMPFFNQLFNYQN